MNLDKVFSELTIIELSSVLAGPAVGMFFAELGAKVIKIENTSTNGDVTRHWKTKKDGPDNPLSAYYYSVNWNKETHLLNLEDSTERHKVLNWITSADIVISNFKKGSAEKLGMDSKSLRARNEKLIYARISAYGDENPKPGFDVSMQAKTGWMYMNGNPDGPPTKMPVALIDLLAAHHLKEGILIALMSRMKTGKGSTISVSLFDSSIASLANQASNWLNLNQVPERLGSAHPNIAPYGDLVETKDGVQLIITTGTEHQFIELCKLLNLNELILDPKFDSNLKRLKRREELLRILINKTLEFSFDELVDRDKDLKSVLVRIQNLKQVFENEQANNLILTQKEENGSISKRVKTAIFKIVE
ncbi:MAG: CaiB/BaiF CoA-transferase family protein [Balneolaceae bacterium]